MKSTRRARGISRHIAIATIALSAASFLSVISAEASPSASGFNPGSIISDEVFYASDSMTVSQIQIFLDSMVDNCRAEIPAIDCLKSIRVDIPEMAATQEGQAGPCSAIGASESASAAEAIYAVAVACGISPKVLIAKLQKEQGLITSTKPTEYMYRAAMGFGCPDSDPIICVDEYAGLFNQLYRAAKQLQWYGDPAGSFTYWTPGNVVSMRLNPKSACGSKALLIENQATAALYYYTPYTPNDAALNNLYGTGDACSSYGNRNFWRFFNDWFGSTQSLSNIVRDSSGTVYLLNGSEALQIAPQDVSRFSWLGQPVDVIDRVFAGFATGDVLRGVVNENLYLSDSGLLEITDCELAAQFGVFCEDSSILAPGHLATLPIAGQWQAPVLGELPALLPSILGDVTVGSTITFSANDPIQDVQVNIRWLRLEEGQETLLGDLQSLQINSDLAGASLVLELVSSMNGFAERVDRTDPIVVGPAMILNLGGGGGGGGPIAPAQASPITVSPIPAGKKIGAVDSTGIAVNVTPNTAEDNKSIELSFGTAKLSLAAPAGASFSEDGRLSIAPDVPMTISATGYQPASMVSGFLIPEGSLANSAFRASSDEVVELGTSIVSQDGSFNFDAKIAAAPGSYLLQLTGTTSDGKETTIALETLVSADQSTKTWAKRLPSNLEAKLYAKNIIGAGKVTFKVNGKEIAWVNAKDLNDKKLRVITEGPMTGASYLVRTIKLQKGKNVLEVYVDGVRTTRVSYSR